MPVLALALRNSGLKLEEVGFPDVSIKHPPEPVNRHSQHTDEPNSCTEAI